MIGSVWLCVKMNLSHGDGFSCLFETAFPTRSLTYATHYLRGTIRKIRLNSKRSSFPVCNSWPASSTGILTSLLQDQSSWRHGTSRLRWIWRDGWTALLFRETSSPFRGNGEDSQGSVRCGAIVASFLPKAGGRLSAKKSCCRATRRPADATHMMTRPGSQATTRSSCLHD